MAEPSFIHLRVHSDYSIVDGLAKTEFLIKQAAILGMPAIAITDFMNLFGLVRFYISANASGIKPIIGADCNMTSKLMGDIPFQLTLLAKNNVGYKNLILLLSRAYQQGYTASTGPVINLNWLVNLGEGLIILSGGRNGDIGRSLIQANNHIVPQCLDFYNKYFPNRYYLELLRTGQIDEEKHVRATIELAVAENLPVVATNNVCFIEEKDFDAHEIRVAINNSNLRNKFKYTSQQYMRSQNEMCNLFSDIPAALENSVHIAKRCNVTIRLGEYFLPKFPTGKTTPENYLIMKSNKGLKERLVFLFPKYEVRIKNWLRYSTRLISELNIINQMGFASYFLVVMEFIQWAKEHNIPVGPGRGSGAGSLVAYALKITDIDPLQFNLLFERFLNPERISMPDFDVDFCMEKRDQVIEHVTKIYGREAVSQIITFGTMTAKAVIKDVGRVLGYPYGFVDRISKIIPSDPGITLKKALSSEAMLLDAYERDEEVKILIDMARKLEGVIRNASKHAGGVVISPTKITDFVPLYCDENGYNTVTQFDKKDVECTGLVKFDFLGLRTLTIIDWTIKMINEHRAIKNLSSINISSIPLNDKKSFSMLQKAETTAVFQLESRGMKDLIQRLKPDCFEDIIALVALFRPGPLQSGMVDNFINRKHGNEKISYPDINWQHKSLKPVLESTYGIILYQEQVMTIAQVLAGYTLGDADMLRRAMCKKKPEEMSIQRKLFHEGAKKIGIKGILPMKIFDLLEKFAGYGFNKSHSAAYALISYQTLWLKTHYPAEFMAAVMTSDMYNIDKVVNMINECRRMDIKVLPPNINLSLYQFYVKHNNEIIYGMGAIKGIGEGVSDAIIHERNLNGEFKDLFDFCSRMDTKKLNNRIIEKLILSGALDCIGSNRALLMSMKEDALKAAEQNAKAVYMGQNDMFSKLLEPVENIISSHNNIKEYSENFFLDGEKETLGLYLTEHPINQYLKEINYYVFGICLKDIHRRHYSEVVSVAGLVLSTKIIVTKRGNRIGIFTLEDHSGRLDVILSSYLFKKYQQYLEKDRILIVSGNVSFNGFNNSYKINALEIMDIDEARKKHVRKLALILNKSQIGSQFLNFINQILEAYKFGTIPVDIYYQKDNIREKLIFNDSLRISLNNDLLSKLRSLIGSENIELKFN